VSALTWASQMNKEEAFAAVGLDFSAEATRRAVEELATPERARLRQY